MVTPTLVWKKHEKNATDQEKMQKIVFCDSYITQVLRNLISNDMDLSPFGTSTVSKRQRYDIIVDRL